MNTPTQKKQEISTLVQELHDAMIESIEATEGEDKAKLRKTKAQKRLSMAREAVRSINLNQ
jgi:ElaB/YqjD/DUF883 family membrane-anchored ribosome-binding protein